MTQTGRFDQWLFQARGVWIAALLSVLIVGVGALMPWAANWQQVRRHGIADAQLRWIPAAPHKHLRFPMEGETPQRIDALRFGDPAAVQISHGFHMGDLPARPMAVLLPATDGRIKLYINGVRLDDGVEPGMGGDSARTPRQRLWSVPTTGLHAGSNRIDILVVSARLRPLKGTIYLGPQASLEPMASWGARLVDAGRKGALNLSILALALNLVAAGVRARHAHLAIAALFAATGAWLLIGDAATIMGQFWPVVDQLLVTAILISMALIIEGAPSPARGPARKGETRFLALTGVSALASLVAAWFEVPAAVLTGTATVVIASLYLTWSVYRRAPAAITISPMSQMLIGAAAGLGTIAVLVCVAGATGIDLAALPFAAEIGNSFALAGLAAMAAVFGAIEAARRIYAILRARIDQALVIQQQRVKLDATKRALNDVSREAAILEERHRMARDVHDGIGGQLASLIAQVRLRRVSMADVEQALMGGLSELRLLVDSLDLVGETLADALSALLVRIRQQTAAGSMELNWSQATDLAVEVHNPRWILNLYRLIQEAVSNAVRHSGGDRISISIERLEDDMLSVRIEDNGSSFDSATTAGGRGLVNMAHRAREAGGRIEFGTSAAHGGAMVHVNLPLPLSDRKLIQR